MESFETPSDLSVNDTTPESVVEVDSLDPATLHSYVPDEPTQAEIDVWLARGVGDTTNVGIDDSLAGEVSDTTNLELEERLERLRGNTSDTTNLELEERLERLRGNTSDIPTAPTQAEIDVWLAELGGDVGDTTNAVIDDSLERENGIPIKALIAKLLGLEKGIPTDPEFDEKLERLRDNTSDIPSDTTDVKTPTQASAAEWHEGLGQSMVTKRTEKQQSKTKVESSKKQLTSNPLDNKPKGKDFLSRMNELSQQDGWSFDSYFGEKTEPKEAPEKKLVVSDITGGLQSLQDSQEKNEVNLPLEAFPSKLVRNTKELTTNVASKKDQFNNVFSFVDSGKDGEKNFKHLQEPSEVAENARNAIPAIYHCRLTATKTMGGGVGSRPAVLSGVTPRPRTAPAFLGGSAGTRQLTVARDTFRYLSELSQHMVNDPLLKARGKPFLDNVWRNRSEIRKHLESLTTTLFSFSGTKNNPVTVISHQQIQKILKENKEWVNISDQMLKCIESSRKASIEDSLCKLLEYTSSIDYSTLSGGAGGHSKMDPNKRLELQAAFPMLILAVMEKQELSDLRKFFKLKGPADPKLVSFVKGIAKYLEGSKFSLRAWSTCKEFIRFLVHLNVVNIEIDHLIMQLFHSLLLDNTTGKGRNEDLFDTKKATFISEKTNLRRGISSNTVLDKTFDNLLTQPFLCGIQTYLGLQVLYSLLDDGVIVRLLRDHRPWYNGKNGEIKGYLDKIKTTLKTELFASPTLSQAKIKKIDGFISNKFIFEKDIDLKLVEFQAGITSIVHSAIAELKRAHDTYKKDSNMPIEAECAYYFLRIRVEHFCIKIKEKTWLNKTKKVKKGKQKTKISVAREGVEELFKHLYATEKFLEVSYPFSKSVDCKKICDSLREEVDNKVLKTLHSYTFAEGRENAFVNSFTDETDYNNWVQKTKDTTDIPEKFDTTPKLFDEDLQKKKITPLGKMFHKYTRDLNLERYHVAK